ncbi:putative efflux protein, MATE family [Jannaschia faecimaris]|uniref:Multidrug export protein MepA n=1 Tax=Jannaschia faecimaris TaxID=1244108 RepID=A0A1H3JTX5_9RHOB|nr:MATE family efflux transporter [Jannaschia faecimaris]SDY43331.1 putative efflux protein, MATE family [Jannaschia faecimaris]
MSADRNPYLHGPLPGLYLRTALPIIFVMGMNGLLAVADALFLGRYVGPEALAAVTLMFPAYMLIVALATLVSSGMNSLLARRLGAGDQDGARAVFAGAHGLAAVCGIALIALFMLGGHSVALVVAGGEAVLADLGMIYLRITVLSSPLIFVLAVNSDALRSEGRVGFMATMSLLVSLANIAFNWVLIAWLDLGVAGSALGTSAAQLLGLGIILTLRYRTTILRPAFGTDNWPRILALGAPQSLTFVGIALGSGANVLALQWVGAPGYGDTISAFGIVTRVLTFTYLPMLGLSHAMQSIVGNNYGAGSWSRSDTSLRIALYAALIYGAAMQAGMTLFAGPIGAVFVGDPVVVAEVARILPMIVALLVLAGPLMMLSAYFQAIGDATRAALLSLTKPYLFALPLTFLLAAHLGEPGIWLAGPASELLLACLAFAVLAHTARRGFGWGLFAAGRT